MSKYVLSCESTVDLPYEYIHQRGIEVLFYTYNVNGEEYIDDMGRNKEALPKFYSFLDAGNIPSTSQINEYKYYKYFKDLLSKGVNILFVYTRLCTRTLRVCQSSKFKLWCRKDYYGYFYF